MAFLIVALAALAAIAVVVDIFRTYNRDAKYILIVSPNGSTVAKRSDRKNQSAEPFQLRGQIPPGTYQLGTDDDNAGVYNVTFSDMTLRPGRIKLMIGDSEVDLMPSRINVDGKDYQWSAESKPSLNSAP